MDRVLSIRGARLVLYDARMIGNVEIETEYDVVGELSKRLLVRGGKGGLINRIMRTMMVIGKGIVEYVQWKWNGRKTRSGRNSGGNGGKMDTAAVRTHVDPKPDRTGQGRRGVGNLLCDIQAASQKEGIVKTVGCTFEVEGSKGSAERKPSKGKKGV